MARNIYDDWIPEEMDSDVIQRVNQVSAVEFLGGPTAVPMGSDTKQVPRSAGVDVEVIAKGGTYGEDVSANTDVTLIARKFGKAIRIAEEDVNDTLANLVAAKQRDWATSYAKMLDNATLATSAAANGTTIPFTSVYNAITNADAETGYAANANHVSSSAAGVVTYTQLSQTVAKVEETDYFDLPNMAVIAHPGFRDKLRGILDTTNRPIFIQGHAGPEGRTPDTLFGLPISWSLGNRVFGTASPNPTGAGGVKGTAGNRLLTVLNVSYLRVGRRSGPETVFIDGRAGLGALTDESILKMRSRRGFAVGHPLAFAVLEMIV
jgi:HK97 family phage major capsid protein